MCFPLVIAAAAVAVSATAAYASNQQANRAAGRQADYNRAVEAQQRDYRVQVMDYQNQTWQQDLDYAGDMLEWSQQEFARQGQAVERAQTAIEKNTIAATGQLLVRQVEEDMSVIAQGLDARRTGKQARAQLAAQDRGVEGNSIDAILGDVTRQEGEALNVMAMNRSASLRAINRQVIAADAQGDQQLASIGIKTYGPATSIRSPAPVSPVNPAAPVAGGNAGQMAVGMAGAVQTGFGTYSALSGQSNKETVERMGSWFSNQFSIGSSSASLSTAQAPTVTDQTGLY